MNRDKNGCKNIQKVFQSYLTTEQRTCGAILTSTIHSYVLSYPWPVKRIQPRNGGPKVRSEAVGFPVVKQYGKIQVAVKLVKCWELHLKIQANKLNNKYTHIELD